MEQHNQEIGTRRDLVLYRLETARNDLKSARALFSIEDYKGANNRAYYSIFHAINEQISNFAQTYPTNLKASSNEALLFMRRYRFANCSCFSCCFKDAYPSSNVQ